MLRKMTDKQRKRLHRKVHIRKSVYGTAERPRLTVFKSGRNLYAQVIDDDACEGQGTTLVAISTLEKDFISLRANVESATKLGEALGARLKDKNITKVVFDRNGYLYHGVVKALADATRKAGIEF
ncbi:MAG: 50S ribosomal protein L18 [Treponema sp.]|jgi:large subunit ribosomal protein L18|nr:50S ribosomal protein L18 [Treponema sp.]